MWIESWIPHPILCSKSHSWHRLWEPPCSRNLWSNFCGFSSRIFFLCTLSRGTAALDVLKISNHCTWLSRRYQRCLCPIWVGVNPVLWFTYRLLTRLRIDYNYFLRFFWLSLLFSLTLVALEESPMYRKVFSVSPSGWSFLALDSPPVSQF